MDERTARYQTLFDASYVALHAYARRRASSAEADDLVAEVLTVAWRRLDDIPADAELPWLYGVARRVLANHHRGRRRWRRLVERAEQERAVAAGAGAAADAVHDALGRLRPDDREVLRLVAWEGLTTSELAVALGCTPNAASLRISRARRRLRAALTEPGTVRTSTEWKVTDA